MAQKRISIADFRPTQLTLGLAEVARRATKIAKMSGDEREAYLHRKAIPHVIGPGKQLYIVDHTIWLAPYGRSTSVRQCWAGKSPIGQWRLARTGAEWRRMAIARRLRRRQSPTYGAIPQYINELMDNVWRSLRPTGAWRSF